MKRKTTRHRSDDFFLGRDPSNERRLVNDANENAPIVDDGKRVSFLCDQDDARLPDGCSRPEGDDLPMDERADVLRLELFGGEGYRANDRGLGRRCDFVAMGASAACSRRYRPPLITAEDSMLRGV